VIRPRAEEEKEARGERRGEGGGQEPDRQDPDLRRERPVRGLGQIPGELLLDLRGVQGEGLAGGRRRALEWLRLGGLLGLGLLLFLEGFLAKIAPGRPVRGVEAAGPALEAHGDMI